MKSILLLLLVAAPVFADEIDRSRYHDLPDIWQRIITTIPVNPGDELSPETRQKYAGQRPNGEYMIYFGANGDIDAIDVLKPIPECDNFVRTWLRANKKRRSPPDLRGPVRELARVEVSFPPAPGAATPAKPRPVPAAPGAPPKNIPPHMLFPMAIDREQPHLPDAVIQKHPQGAEIAVAYYVTVGTDGQVTSVDPLAPTPKIDPTIIATLKRWRFKPQPIPVRTMLRFQFTIPPGKPR